MGKILVIDDEKPTLSMFQLFLSAYGYTVLTAENGEDGLSIFKEEKPSIVVTDIKMPGIDGLELLKRIKTIDAKSEVIVMTGHGDMELAVEALNLNATDFINKPINRSSLESALKRAEARLKSFPDEVKKVTFRSVKGITVMEIEGNITSKSESVLFDAYDKACQKGVSKMVMLFNENATINGAGIDLLMRLLSNMKERNQRVAITGISENFKKIFETVGIRKVAEIFGSEEEAVASLI